MDKDATVLNFDDSYLQQAFLCKKNIEWLDLRHIRNTNLMCKRETLRHIQRRLQQRKGKGITFIGSGNYHYITYLLLKEIQTPFTLILFDHHSDMLPSMDQSLISCGSWVLESLQNLPLLKKVCLIGIDKKWKRKLPITYSDKVIVLDKEENITEDKLFQQLFTHAVYISIDKDVLNTGEAITAWDHGDLTIRKLINFMQTISDQREVLGVDVCGEYPARLTDMYQMNVKKAIKKNELANYLIFKAAKESTAS